MRYQIVVCCFCSLLWWSATPCAAQKAQSARQIGLGGYAIAQRGDVGSLFSNPAGMGVLDRPTLLLSHRYYHHQPDVSAQGLAIGTPTALGLFFGVSLFQYGLPEAYIHREAGVYLGRRFGPNLRIALGGTFRMLTIPGYVRHQDGQLLFSAHLDMSSVLSIGLVLDGLSYNFTASDDNRHLRDPGVNARAGIVYHFSDFLSLQMDLVYQQQDPFAVHGGLEYQLLPNWFWLRMGLRSSDLTPAGGLGVRWSRFRMDLGSDFHRHVGMSPQLDLSISF